MVSFVETVPKLSYGVDLLLCEVKGCHDHAPSREVDGSSSAGQSFRAQEDSGDDGAWRGNNVLTQTRQAEQA